jgi:hypothetical protein
MAQKVNKFVYDAAERRKANFVLFFSKITFWNRVTLIDASKEVGLEVKIEKTKYTQCDNEVPELTLLQKYY